ncbi:unnamed protein product [Lampetra fluviatilis]
MEVLARDGSLQWTVPSAGRARRHVPFERHRRRRHVYSIRTGNSSTDTRVPGPTGANGRQEDEPAGIDEPSPSLAKERDNHPRPPHGKPHDSGETSPAHAPASRREVGRKEGERERVSEPSQRGALSGPVGFSTGMGRCRAGPGPMGRWLRVRRPVGRSERRGCAAGYAPLDDGGPARLA